MNRPARFMVVVPLLSIFMGMSLSALAQEPRRGEPRAAMHHAQRRFDPHHFDHRLWALGRAYPHGCHWGRCGYWWWADGYWYFYDHPLSGPPEAVSEIAYDEQGNLVPVGAAMSGPEGMAPSPPGAIGPPPPPPTNSNGTAAATTSAPRTRSCGRGDRWRHDWRHYRWCAGPRTGGARRRSSWGHDGCGCRCGGASAPRRILLVARRLLLSLSEWCLVAANGSALLRLLS